MHCLVVERAILAQDEEVGQLVEGATNPASCQNSEQDTTLPGSPCLDCVRPVIGRHADWRMRTHALDRHKILLHTRLSRELVGPIANSAVGCAP